jgi:hypothetical protein
MFFRWSWVARRVFLLALLAQGLSPAAAFGLETSKAPQELLKRQVFRLIADYTATIGREERISLATNLPGLFGFRFVCLFKPETGEPFAVIPGDTVEAASRGKLACPDGIESTLEEKTKVHIRQIGSLPFYRLEAGSMTVRFGKTRLLLSAAGLELELEGHSFLQEVIVRPEKEATAFLCQKGNALARLEAGEEGGKHFVASTHCRLEVINGADALVEQVLSGDAVQISNIHIPREFRPNLKALLGPEFAVPTTLWFEAGKVRWTTVKLQPNRKTECSLYSQPAPDKRAVVLKTFVADAHEGAVELASKPTPEQGFFLLCEDESGGWSSGLLPAPK